MAIRLASAIGQQREPIGILGGLDDAINKTGDAIQAKQKEAAKEAAKKADQDQQYKDAVLASIEVKAPDKAFPEQKQEYENFAKGAMAELLVMSKDPKASRAELKKKADALEYGLQDRLNVYGEAYDSFGKVVDKAATHDTGLFDAWFSGKTNPTQVAEMPNDDFMAASEADRAGKMVGDNGMQATETTTKFQDKPYLTKTFEEQKATPFRNKANELVTLKKPDIVKAAQGYLGSDFKFGSLTKRTDKVSPTTGEFIYEFDEQGADQLAKKFASSMVGDGNFGSKDHSQYQKAIEYEAMRAGNEAGFSGDRLKEFVQEVVPQIAYDDFMRDARVAELERSKNEKDITKNPSKGGGFTQNFGGGRFKTKSGDYQFNDNQEDTTDEQRYKNFVDGNKPMLVAEYVKSGKGTKKEAIAFYESDKGKESLRKGFDLYYSKSPNVVGVTISSTERQDDLNPSTLVKDSKGQSLEFVPVRYNINKEQNKPTSIYGYKRVKTKQGDKMVTELEATTIPYNINTVGVNAIAPDLADLYKKQYGNDLDLSVDEKKGEAKKVRKVVKTGTTKDGKKVIKYDDGTIEIQ